MAEAEAGDRPPDVFGTPQDGIEVGFRKDQREFLATVATRYVAARFTVLREQACKILGAALSVAQQREENLRRGDHHLPGTLHDLPLLHGRQLDQPPELRARLVSVEARRSTAL